MGEYNHSVFTAKSYLLREKISAKKHGRRKIKKKLFESESISELKQQEVDIFFILEISGFSFAALAQTILHIDCLLLF